MRKLRFALRPRWLALHLVAVALVVTMVLLGRWQLTVSEHKHFSLQNFGYAIQWWAFSTFVVIMWVRAMRDAARRPAHPEAADEVAAPVAEPITYRRYVPPTSSARAGEPVDDVHSAYNDYLARLNAEDDA